MIKSIEFFRDEYLPTLSRLTSYNATARALGISERAVFVWIRESREAMKSSDAQSSVYYFEFEEGEGPRYLHEHIKSLIRNCDSDIEANFRARCRDGFWRVNKWQGRTVWCEDSRLAGLDDETLEMLGYPDRLLRVNGELVPETEWVPPSTDAVVKFLESHSKKYARKSSVDVNVQGRVGIGGVARVAWDRPAPQLQQVEVLSDTLASMVATDTEPDPPAREDEPEDEENVVSEAPSDDAPEQATEPSPMACPPEPALQPVPLPDYAASAERYGDLSPSQMAIMERFNQTRRAT